MTELEFKNLSLGEEVWVVKGYADSLVVKGVISYISNSCLDGCGYMSVCINCDPGNYSYCDVFKTEVEAYQNCLDKNEWFLKQANQNLEELTTRRNKSREALIKAKKRAEEIKWKWIANFASGKVSHTDMVAKKDVEGWFRVCDTEQEAYEALAEFYEKKAKEAWTKSGVKYYGGYKSVALLTKIKPCSKYPGNVTAKSLWQKSCYCGHSSAEPYCVDGSGWSVSEESLFDTEEEAYAEMEKRTPNHVRGKDEFAEKMRKKNK